MRLFPILVLFSLLIVSGCVSQAEEKELTLESVFQRNVIGQIDEDKNFVIASANPVVKNDFFNKNAFYGGIRTNIDGPVDIVSSLIEIDGLSYSCLENKNLVIITENTVIEKPEKLLKFSEFVIYCDLDSLNVNENDVFNTTLKINYSTNNGYGVEDFEISGVWLNVKPEGKVKEECTLGGPFECQDWSAIPSKTILTIKKVREPFDIEIRNIKLDNCVERFNQTMEIGDIKTFEISCQNGEIGTLLDQKIKVEYYNKDLDSTTILTGNLKTEVTSLIN